VNDHERLRALISASLKEADHLTLYDAWKRLASLRGEVDAEEALSEIAKAFLKVEPKKDAYAFEKVLAKEVRPKEARPEKLTASLLRWMVRFLREVKELSLSKSLVEELNQQECLLHRALKESGSTGTELGEVLYATFREFKEQIRRIYESLLERDYINAYLLYVRAVKSFFNLFTLLSTLSLKRAAHEAKTDPLTGLLNRRYLMPVLKDVLELSQYAEKPFTVALLDIDDFKKINDELGHLVGDCVLKELAKLLKSFFRKGDYVFRYGGEEFLVVMPSTGKEEARRLLERLRRRVEEHLFPCTKGGLKLTVSVGACSDAYAGDREPEYYLACADANLYRAKRAGKNRVVL